MCGRYVSVTPPEEVAAYFAARYSAALSELVRPSWNVPPTTDVLAVTAGREGGRDLVALRWGLVPGWASGLSFGAHTINARAETIATKPSFREAFRTKRCLIPADGYFEWKTTPGEVRQPYYFTRTDGSLLAFAGLWEAWRPPLAADTTSPWFYTCAIVTTGANADVEEIHTRMPAILEPDVFDLWLSRENSDVDELAGLLHPASPGTLVRRRVGRAVGNVRNDGPELIDELTESPSLF
jgi:putative SOS response-associated peptidase YedK